MLKIKFLFIAVLLLCCSMFAQNLWTNEIQINFIIQSSTKVTSFVNENGVHLVYSRNGGLPPPFLFIYHGVKNGTDIYKPAFYSSRHGGQAV